MFIAPHEWLPATQITPAATVLPLPDAGSFDHAGLYRKLMVAQPGIGLREAAADFVHGQLAQVAGQPGGLPEVPEDLGLWMAAATQSVHSQYVFYVKERKAGAPRRFFTNRAHALYFLRGVAPSKLVDGAWLYGVLAHWRQARFSDLLRTYVEELGEGAPDKNHVLLYRGLLARHGLDPFDDLPDALYQQGLVQLALGWNAEHFLPEVIGFNLAYEQLPLHLLITAYELNELGLDPYYFTLHVTVDNPDTGHARRACQALLDTLPRMDDGGAFWRRVREGSKLAEVGVGTTRVIQGFDIEAEVMRILTRKAGAGNGAHSDYCRVAGRGINDWLSAPHNIAGFLQALEQAGWIKRGEPAQNSRFWNLLQGERAEMFGVFSNYELQVIHDWIRGEASADGQAYATCGAPAENGPVPTFRAAQRLATRHAAAGRVPAPAPMDADLSLLEHQLAQADEDGAIALLVQAMSPARHWTAAGLYATRLFCQSVIR